MYAKDSDFAADIFNYEVSSCVPTPQAAQKASEQTTHRSTHSDTDLQLQLVNKDSTVLSPVVFDEQTLCSAEKQQYCDSECCDNAVSEEGEGGETAKDGEEMDSDGDARSSEECDETVPHRQHQPDREPTIAEVLDCMNSLNEKMKDWGRRDT